MTSLNMASPATYLICVQGCIPADWEAWIENTTIAFPPGSSRTTLTCRVRDQADLLGILLKLNGLNAPLISVTLDESQVAVAPD